LSLLFLASKIFFSMKPRDNMRKSFLPRRSKMKMPRERVRRLITSWRLLTS
jgi:hypothetical protein